MGRNISPLVQEELDKLEKDAESRKLAMKALKSYATNIDTKAIPQFLAQVSETNGQGSPSGECTISLFEVLARVHGRNIVPQIDSIMNTIIRTLSTSAGSFPLHQACSKVVPAIARYGIDPSTPGVEKKMIICSLSMPLSNVLMSSHESLASGAALCLKALVESTNWKFASDDTINDVCLKVAGALEEKTSQTNSHMGLAMALAKHNPSIAEAYVGSLLRSGLHLLSVGSKENNSQKRFAAIQMINFLMKCIDARSISSELADVAGAMEKCQDDHMPFVKGAAFEALQTAKSIASQKGSKCDVSCSPTTNLKFHRRNEKNPQVDLEKLDKPSSVELRSPESHTVVSSIRNADFTDSPSSVKHITSNSEYHGRQAQRRLWMNELGGVDLSFRDSFFIKAFPIGDVQKAERDKVKEEEEHEMSRSQSENAESFNGFMLSNDGSAESPETTPSPQKSRQQLGFDDIKIYSTPRKLMRFLQDRNGDKKEVLSPVPCRIQSEPAEDSDFLDSDISTVSKNTSISDTKHVCQSIESVSSTADPVEDEGSEDIGISAAADLKVAQLEMVWHKKAFFVFVCGLGMVLLASIISIMRDGSDKISYGLVPT